MGVSRHFAAVIGLSVLAFAPSAEAAPILAGTPGVSCGALVSPATTNCGLFNIDPVSSLSLSGAFEFDNDVALFQFLLGPGSFTFNASTTSAGVGFDPILALFGPGGTQFTYPGPDGSLIPALAFDPAFDADAVMPTLTLAGNATYTLALTQFGNFPHEALQLGFDQDAFPCFTILDPSVACEAGAAGMFEGRDQTGGFSLSLSFTSETASVPEPGTLSLLALGSLGAALVCRRRGRRR